jgi:hypothetical protein
MAKIEVKRREGGWVDRARKYKVLVDGEEVGRVGAGESVTADVPAGSHEVSLKIDWCRSRKQTVQLGADETASFACRPNASALTILYYISFGMGNYVRLEPAGELPPPPAPLPG